jgi:hypothetical protein
LLLQKQRETAAQFEHIQQRLERLAHQYQIWIIAGTLPAHFVLMVRSLKMVVYVQSAYVSALKGLKHVMTKFICLMFKWVMLSVGIRIKFLNLVIRCGRQNTVWQYRDDGLL